MRVISLNGVKSALGVKVNAAPFRCHEPGVAGERLGIGELVAGGAESVTVMVAFAETPTAPALGLTDKTLSAAGATVAVVGEEGLAPWVGALELGGSARRAVWVVRAPTTAPTTSARTIKAASRIRETLPRSR